MQTYPVRRPMLGSSVRRRDIRRFLEIGLNSIQPKLLDGSKVELPGAVPQCTKHLPSVLFAEHQTFPEIAREPWVSLNEEPIYDSAIVCDDIPEVHTQRCVRRIGILREKHKVQVLLEILRQSIEVLRRQLAHPAVLSYSPFVRHTYRPVFLARDRPALRVFTGV
jgi:hypothetical protein